MPEWGQSGYVRGAHSNGCSYRDAMERNVIRVSSVNRRSRTAGFWKSTVLPEKSSSWDSRLPRKGSCVSSFHESKMELTTAFLNTCF